VASLALERPAPVGDRAGVSEADPIDATIAALVVATRRGDPRAFAALYQRFARVVHAVALARVRFADAHDVVQDVFLIAYERLGELREPAAFPGWLMQIARRRAVDAGVAAGRDRTAPAAERGADPPPTAEAHQALAAIRALPEAYRETLIMRLVEGLTGPEIADRTGLAPGSVRVNLHRGMMLLRDRLGVRVSDTSVDAGDEP
jgi:RNA polymerase sigma-70 factor (ECF subfamily)